MDMYVPNNTVRPVVNTPSRSPINPQPAIPIVPKPIATTPPAIKPPVSKPTSDIQAPSAKFWLVFLLIVIVFGGSGAGAAYYFLKYKPAHKTAVMGAATVDNTNHITDDTVGVKFAISKDLVAIDKAELVKQNPSFIYGFKQADVPNLSCTISQQKRDPVGGPVSAEALKNGTIDSLKKAFPDAVQDDFQDILLKNGQDAASIVVHYTDNKTALKERMIIVATNPRVTFAFCKSPASVFDLYKAKFNTFFDSLEVY